MKKQIILMMLILALGGSGINAQPLENTTWKVYFPTGTFFAYYHIGVDTISISFDNITYTNMATYQASGNTIIAVDLYDGDCSVSDTGRYTYAIQNDTLRFTLISDPCIQRSIAMTTFHFVRLATGIGTTLGPPAMKIYPNPASNAINFSTPVKGSLFIYNTRGQQLLQKEITAPTATIDVSLLKSGVYLLKVVGENGVQTGKMVKW